MTLNKLIIRIISLAMVVLMFSTVAFAEEIVQTEENVVFEEVTDETVISAEDVAIAALEAKNAELRAKLDEEVSILTYLGVYDNTENIKLTDKLTKAQFTSMLVHLIGMGGTGEAVQIFEDIQSDNVFFTDIWTAYSIGIVNGGSDGRFHGGKFVSYDEAVKMAVCALGFGEAAQAQGGYPTGYKNLARIIGMLDNVKVENPSALTISDASMILFGVLNSNAGKEHYSSKTEQGYTGISATQTYLNSRYGIYRGTGIVTDTVRSIYNESKKELAGKIGINGQIVDLADDVLEFTEDDILGRNVYFYYRKVKDEMHDEVCIIRPRDTHNVVIKIKGKDITSIVTNKQVTYYNENDREISKTFADDAVYYYNGVKTSKIKYEDIKDNAYLEIVDNDHDGHFEYVFLTVYNRVEVVETSNFGKIEAKYTDWVMTKEETDEADFYRDGIQIKPNFIGNWDILKVKADRYDNILSIDVFFKEVIGTVEKYNHQKKEVTIDGQVYGVADEYLDALKKGHYSTYELTKGLNATFITDGETVYGVHEITEQKKQYGYLVKMVQTGKGLDSGYQVKIFAIGGKMGIFNVPERVKVDGKKVDAEVLMSKLRNPMNGKIQDQLVMYSVSNDELKEIDLADDATGIGMDNDNFSLDYKSVWDGVSTKTNWNYDASRRTLFDEYHIPSQGISIPVFYIPKDLGLESYYKTADAVQNLTSYNKDTDVYIYDGIKYTEDYDLKYPQALVIKERTTTTSSTGTTGPYTMDKVINSNYNFLIIVNEIVEEVNDDDEVVKAIYGTSMGSSSTLEFGGVFAEDVWNADRENDFHYGSMTVDDLKRGDIIKVSYSNSTDAVPEIDCFAVFATLEDMKAGKLFTSYNVFNDSAVTSNTMPYFIFGEIVICKNNQMIIKSTDYTGKTAYYTMALASGNQEKVVYNIADDSIEAATESMYTTGVRVAIVNRHSGLVRESVIIIEE